MTAIQLVTRELVEEEFAQLHSEQARLGGTSGSGGDGPTDDKMDRRIATLEKTAEKIDAKLEKLVEGRHSSEIQIERRLNSIENKLGIIDVKVDSKASSIDVSDERPVRFAEQMVRRHDRICGSVWSIRFNQRGSGLSRKT